MGYVALFFALSIAPAWAATIGSRDIARNAVLSKHIKRGNVKGSDVAANAINSAKVADGSLTGVDVADGSLGTPDVNPSEIQRRVTGSCASGQAVAAVTQAGGLSCVGTGGPPSGPAGGDLAGDYPNPQVAAGAVDSAKVADDSLTGTDIIEGTLGTVPAAVQAQSALSASSVGGVRVFPIEFNAGASTGTTTVLSPPDTGGFTIDASCAANSDLTVQAHAPAGADLIMSSSTDTVTGAAANAVYQPVPTDVDLAPDDDDQIGQTVYRVGGSVLMIKWAADNSGLNTCEFNGVATLH